MELKSVISLFLFLCLLEHLECTDQKELKVKGGEDATLECSGPKNATLVMIRWEKSEDIVILFRDGRFQENLQHELFKGRVSMKDPKWKETGDLSVILKHVTMNDAGKYECKAANDGQKPRSLNRVTLKVENSELQVKQGENATLECYGPKDANSVMLRWNRTNLQSHEYVFYFSDNQIQEDKQHPSFKGRVNLKDPEMKNGDFSVNLTNVVMNDSGIYECYVGYNGKKPELINSTYLKVEEPGQPGGHTEDGGKEEEGEKSRSVGPAVGLSVSAVILVVAVVGFVIYRKYGNSNYQSPSEQGQQMEMSS